MTESALSWPQAFAVAVLACYLGVGLSCFVYLLRRKNWPKPGWHFAVLAISALLVITAWPLWLAGDDR